MLGPKGLAMLGDLINVETLNKYILNHAETNQVELERLQGVFDDKCDELRISLEENARLRGLLNNAGIEHEVEN